MPLNFGLGGKTYEPVTRVVEAEEIARYAVASGDDNAAHAVGPNQIASPIFPVVPGLPLVAIVTLDPELGVDNPLMIVHGEETIVHHRPVVPGDTLQLTASLEAVEDKGTSAVFVVGVHAATTAGEPVNDQFATIVVRGAGSGAGRESSADRKTPQRGDPMSAFVSHVDADMPERYAEASGDRNPIHLDADLARAVGLPGVINHGLGTLSLVTGGLVRELADGDPARVARVEARFTSMVIPGSDLSTSVWRASNGAHPFETRGPDGSLAMTGSVEVH
jgi:acyl dehydratase